MGPTMTTDGCPPGLRLGVTVHLTLWLALASAALFLGRHAVFPHHPSLAWLLLLVPTAAVVSLWLGGRPRHAALLVGHVVSVVAAVLVAAELVLTALAPPRTELTRYPYPYRMHGFAPLAVPDETRYHATTNDTGLRERATIPRKPEGELRVLVLGGSTMFGVGSGDGETAVARMQALLLQAQRARPLPATSQVTVINAGQGWYNSTQELVFLVTELALYEPDLVLVVDGYNDAHHAMVWNCRPPASAVTAAEVVNLERNPGILREVGWDQPFRLAAEASAVRQRLAVDPSAIIGPPCVSERAAMHMGPAAGGYGSSMKHRLVMNWTLMDRLGKAFGCRFAFSLQPCVFAKPSLGASEQAYVDSQRFTPLMRRTWAALEEFVGAEARRLDLSTFAADAHVRGVEGSVFTDYCHLTPPGNALLAQAMAEAVEHELEAWPWEADWDGVRYAFQDGDPIWRPGALDRQDAWR
jgi:lysophospholipase L1-like esterase